MIVILEAILTALLQLFEPAHLIGLLGGVVMGLFLGAVPGLGGIVGLALLLPFTFKMEASVAIATMMGMLSTIHTGDTIPAVLFGIPGTASAQATILDGHPMAKRGEAERALGAAFMASIAGGIFGALVLSLSLPILRPLVLAFGSPEFFMLGAMGITMVSVLSSGSVLRGLLAASLGLLLAMIGPAPQSAYPRWDFGQLYLLDGVPLVPVTLGIFAIPEMIELFIKGTRIAEPVGEVKGHGTLAMIRQAIRDIARHWFLVLRCGLIGTWVGAMPGMGSSVVDWLAYGHAATTERGARDTFGKGDIRGVIAPESANNSKNGGELIPTLAFGIPGSASMAVFLGALLYHDVRPGLSMLTTQVNLTLIMILSLALANIIGGGLCLLLTRPMARVATLPGHYLVPAVMVVAAFAAFQTTREVGDLVALAVFSMLGWFLKSAGWPRPPLILAFVLGPLLENYLFISTKRFGAEWLLRPGVLVLAVLILFSIVYGLRKVRKGQREQAEEVPEVKAS